MSTSWDYTLTTHLPLPSPNSSTSPSHPETDPTTLARGITIALSLLHDPEVTIKHDKSHLTIENLSSTDPRAVNLTVLGPSFNVDISFPPPPSASLPLFLLPADPATARAEDKWTHHLVTEEIPLPLPFLNRTSKIIFPTALRCNPDGLEALSDPGSSVTVYLRYSLGLSDSVPPPPNTTSSTTSPSGSAPAPGDVRGREGEAQKGRYLILKEVTTTKCSFLLAWYIKRTMGAHHENFHRWLKDRFVERMSEAL